MAFWDGWFGKNEDPGSTSVKLDLIDNGFILNDREFSFPARASEVSKILGNARIVQDQYDPKMMETYKEKYGLDPFNPWDYYWDEAGLIARTYDHETIHELFVYIHTKRDYPFPMPEHTFSGTLLIHGKPWEESAVGHYGGAVQLGKLGAYVLGNCKKAQTIWILEVFMKDEAKKALKFFDQESEEIKEFQTACQPEYAKRENTPPKKMPGVYISGKYWWNLIGDSDQSMNLLEYLATKTQRDIPLQMLLTELGFDQPGFSFRKPDAPITVTIKDGLEIEFHHAIQTVADLAALLLESKKNQQVDLKKLSDGETKGVITITSTPTTEKILIDVLEDFCKTPLEYDICEVCPKAEVLEMAELCADLKKELTEKQPCISVAP